MSIWSLLNLWLMPAWLLIVAFYMVRVLIIGRYNTRALNVIAKHQKGLLYASFVKNEERDQLIEFSLVHRNNRFSVLFDLRKWTFADFYPEIVSYPVTAALLGYPDIDGAKWEEHMGRAHLGRGVTRI